VKWALGKSLDEKNAGSEKSLKNHAFLDRQQSGDDPGPLYSESCISKAEYLFQKVRQNYKQAISTVRQYVHLRFGKGLAPSAWKVLSLLEAQNG